MCRFFNSRVDWELKGVIYLFVTLTIHSNRSDKSKMLKRNIVSDSSDKVTKLKDVFDSNVEFFKSSVFMYKKN